MQLIKSLISEHSTKDCSLIAFTFYYFRIFTDLQFCKYNVWVRHYSPYAHILWDYCSVQKCHIASPGRRTTGTSEIQKKLAWPIYFLSWKYCVGHTVCLIILYLFHNLSCYTNTVETFMQTIRFTIVGSNKKANTEKTVHFVEVSSDALQRSSVGHCQHIGCCKLSLQTQRNSLV